MVVMIIISILAVIGLPVFQRQIGKSREAELKLKLGAIARSQTAYHYVHGSFALTMDAIEADTGQITSTYYTFPDPTGDSNTVKHQAIAINPGLFQLRNYAIGIYNINGAYGRATCQGLDVGDVVNVGNTPDEPCTNNGVSLN